MGKNVEIDIEFRGKLWRVDRGTTGFDFAQIASEQLENRLVAASYYNNVVTSLRTPMHLSAPFTPIYLDSDQGVTIYRQTLFFLLEMASLRVLRNNLISVHHTIGKSVYYTFESPIEERERALIVAKIEKEMRAIVEKETPIHVERVSFHRAKEIFLASGYADTVDLIENLNNNGYNVNNCDGFLSLAHSPLLPSTGEVKVFEIVSHREGFLLRYPSSLSPSIISPFKDEPVLYNVYKEAKERGRQLKVHCVGQLNRQARNENSFKKFIQVLEAIHEKHIASIVDQITKRKEELEVILIAGPSSSGKTTFSKRLAIQLEAAGYAPILISLDDFYLPRKDIPVDKSGEVDLESIKALDLPLLDRCFAQLIETGEAELPVYNFLTSARKPEGRKICKKGESLLILEGIHGLNEQILSSIKRSAKFKVYISALTQLRLDSHTRISTTDNRLIRRIVRDHKFRGYNAKKTLEVWPSVIRGEKRNIFPFQSNADVAFNSALDYELSVLKVFAEPLLRMIKPDDAVYPEASRLISFLNNFMTVSEQAIPPFSILREFIGESWFDY